MSKTDQAICLPVSEDPKLKDARGRSFKVGARVRGTYKTGVEVHGHIVKIYNTEKHGWVLAIEEKQGNVNNVPAELCRRMYGDTRATKAVKQAATKKAVRKVRRKL